MQYLNENFGIKKITIDDVVLKIYNDTLLKIVIKNIKGLKNAWSRYVFNNNNGLKRIVGLYCTEGFSILNHLSNYIERRYKIHKIIRGYFFLEDGERFAYKIYNMEFAENSIDEIVKALKIKHKETAPDMCKRCGKMASPVCALCCCKKCCDAIECSKHCNYRPKKKKRYN